VTIAPDSSRRGPAAVGEVAQVRLAESPV